MKQIVMTLVIVVSVVCVVQLQAIDGFDEAAVRIKMADAQLGEVIGFYRQHAIDDPSTAEAVRRWDYGVRCTNLHKFERKVVAGRGWLVVHRGTEIPVNGIDVELSTDRPKHSEKPSYDEASVRYKLADSQLGNVIGFYRSHAEDDPHTAEAVRRWDLGVRVINLYMFERKIIGERGWLVVHRGTNIPVSGLDIKLNTDE